MNDENIDIANLEEKINLIIRQTDLEYNQAKQCLENNGGDCIKVLEFYYGIKSTKNNKKISTINQQIYSEIRSVMDDASYRFYNEK
jgi:hypothetical protein